MSPKPGAARRPHVVILGAGASRACCPSGDVNGRVLPLMRDLTQVVGLRPLLTGRGIPWEEENFEALYSRLAADPKHAGLVKELEHRLEAYFSSLALPATPTLYDYLVLGLRGKDLIATFNWDPLLLQACARNSKIASMPGVVFLHGCVSLGVCYEHKKVADRRQLCRICHRPLAPMPLLYPADKDYNSDPLIRDNWATVERALEEAFYLTFIGYSFSEADMVARENLQGAWASNHVRNLMETDVIDTNPSADLLRAIESFRVGAHGRIFSRMRDAEPFINPRRSCEALWERTQEGFVNEGSPYPEFATLDDLHDYAVRLVAEEDDLI
jgi:hypothetical protein